MVFLRYKISVIRYTIIFMGLTVFASPAAAATISLQQSVALALQHNRLLAADQYRVDAARMRVDEASGHLLPRLDAGYTAMRTNSPLTVFGAKLMQQRVRAADFNPTTLNNPSAINNFQPALSLTMPLYQGGKLWAGREQAAQGVKGSEYQHAWLRQQTIFQTIQTYMAWLNADAQLVAAEKSLQASHKNLSNVQSMRKRGILLNSDVMDAQVRRLQNEVRVNQGRNAVAYARDLLARLTGLSAGKFNRPVAAAKLHGVTPVAELADVAVRQRPDLQAMQASLAAVRAAVDMEKASFMPHLSLQARQEWNSPTAAVRNGNATVMAIVSMNLFAGGSDRAALNRREADAARLSLELADKKQQIVHEVRQALRQFSEAEARHKAESEAMNQALESLRITELRHAQGLEKTSDLLDAQSRADQARAESIRSVYDVAVAKAQLLLVSGGLDETSLQGDETTEASAGAR
ncbi:MAG: TolC family protein [Mariprofundus sp.]